MLPFRKIIILSLLLAVFHTGCEQKTSEDIPILLTLKEAKAKEVFLATYIIKEYGVVEAAYSYSWLQKNILLLNTNSNIESEGKFLALDKTGKAGRVFATDSTYMIVIDNPQLLNNKPLTLYEFTVEKPDEKYQLSLTDSLILEAIIK